MRTQDPSTLSHVIKAAAILPTAAVAVGEAEDAAAASATEHYPNLTLLCTSRHREITARHTVQGEQGTCAYCQWRRRRHRNCHERDVTNVSRLPAALPSYRSTLLHRWPLEAECPLGVAAEVVGLQPPPPTHTHSLQSRGQAILVRCPPYTI